MRSLFVRWLLVALLVGVWVAAGLKAYWSRDALARLHEAHGQVERDFPGEVGQWTEARRRSVFRVGDAIKTGVSARAILLLEKGHRALLEEATVVRFLDTLPDTSAPGLLVETGSVLLEVGSQPLSFESGAGLATLEPLSRVVLKRQNDQLRFDVLMGLAQIDVNGHRSEVKSGHFLEVSLGSAFREAAAKFPVPSPTAGDDAPAARQLEPVALAPSLEVDQLPATPIVAAQLPGSTSEDPVDSEYPDMIVTPGESFVVHDPFPPTLVGFRVAKTCPTGSVVDLLRRGNVAASATSQAGELVILRFEGIRRYRVRCLGKSVPEELPAAKGKITVLEDSGAASAAFTRIATDGRTYTVLYHNRSPTIAVDWLEAPDAQDYLLKLEAPGDTKTIPTPKPSHTFEPGELAAGSYVLQFAARETTSQLTRLTVRLDYATSPRLHSPANGEVVPGQTTTVAGIAAPDWTISAAGRELPLDADWRFSGDVVVPSGQRTLQVRFSHPTQGLHYHLRRYPGRSTKAVR